GRRAVAPLGMHLQVAFQFSLPIGIFGQNVLRLGPGEKAAPDFRNRLLRRRMRQPVHDLFFEKGTHLWQISEAAFFLQQLRSFPRPKKCRPTRRAHRALDWVTRALGLASQPFGDVSIVDRALFGSLLHFTDLISFSIVAFPKSKPRVFNVSAASRRASLFECASIEKLSSSTAT